MWWTKRQNDAPKEVIIHAHLRQGETLQITFNDEREPRELQIDGCGEVRLTLKAPIGVAAEMVQTQAQAAGSRPPLRPAAGSARR